MALDEEHRARRIFDLGLAAIQDDAPVVLVALGNILRDHYSLAWGEHVLWMATGVPGARQMALFELAVAEALRGRPERAIAYLNACEQEGRLSAHGHRVYAAQLERLGRLQEARQRFDLAADLEP